MNRAPPSSRSEHPPISLTRSADRPVEHFEGHLDHQNCIRSKREIEAAFFWSALVLPYRRTRKNDDDDPRTVLITGAHLAVLGTKYPPPSPYEQPEHLPDLQR